MKPAWRRLAKLFAVLFGIILLYQILLHPTTVEYLIETIVKNRSRSKISLKIQRSSLIYGFHIDDLYLETETGEPILRIPRFRLTWFLPGFLAGHIGLREFGVYDAEIYVTEKDGTWNLDYLRKQTTKEKKEEKKEEEKKEPRDIIRTYFPLKLYGNIEIQNLQFHYKSETVNRSLDVKGLDVRLAFITDTFTSIPLNTGALELFETLVVAVNPYGPLEVAYEAESRLEGKLTFHYRLFRQTVQGQGILSSFVNLDTTGLTLSRNGFPIMSPGLVARYHTSYNQEEDALVYREFYLGYDKNPWLSFQARVDQLTSPRPSLNFSVLKSEIDLNPPGRFLSLLTGGKIQMGGYLSFYPLQFRGPLDKMQFYANAKGNGIFVRGPGQHQIPLLNLVAEGSLNLYEILPFLEPPEEYNKEEERKNLAYGFIHELNLESLQAGYNGSTLDATGTIKPGQGVDAAIRIQGFNLGQFLEPTVTGTGSADLKASSTENFDELDIEGRISVYGGRYRIGRSRSGINNLILNTRGKLLFEEEQTIINIENLNLSGTNEGGLNFLSLTGSADLVLGKGTQNYQANIGRLAINYEPMMTTLPARLRYPIRPYGAYLNEGLILGLQAGIQSSTEGTSIQGNGKLTVPSISADSLNLSVQTDLSEGKVGIPMLRISGLRGALNATLTGSLNTAPELQPYLQFRLNLARAEMLPVHENVSIQGDVAINLDVNPQLATGGIYINDLDIQVNTGNCKVEQSPACKRLRVEKLNLNLPIRHNMAMKDPVRLSDTSSGLALTDTGFRSDPNFTVRFVASSHTPGGTFKPESFFYLGSLDSNKGYGLSARVDYRRNIFMIDWLDARIYKPRDPDTGELWAPDGTIQGKRILFNAADLAPANMEYAGFMQIHNLNLAPFFPDSDSTFDGIISGDLSISGRDLTDVIRNTNMRLSVYRISEEFTGFAVRLLIPNDIIAFAVNNTLEIPAIQVELKGGLIYTSVKVKRPSLLSLSVLVRPSEEEIRQERIPLAEFLERARTESTRFARETGGAQE